MSLEPGARLGPYEVVAAIGAGGMGEVYRARDTKLDRDVALKILPEALAADPDRLMRFEREAKTLAALNHPNIASIYGVEESAPLGDARGAVSGSRTALVMELVEGEDLSHRIAQGAMPIEDVLPIAQQIAAALEAAHEAGIIHRDLKPANIKIKDDGTVKVLDFGLAKAMAPLGDGSGSRGTDPTPSTMTSPALTAMGLVLGTAAYMSPEQARGRAVDKRADIWAFGAVMYEALAGERLFTGDTVSDTIASVLTREPDLSRVPPGWRRLLAKCLEKDLRHRLRDIGDAWLLLDSASQAPVHPSRSPLRSVAPWAIAALVLGAAGMWAASSLTSAPAAAEPTTFVEGPPAGTRFMTAPEPSPDGRHLAMLVLDESGETSIWVRSLEADTARVLEGTEHAFSFFWSPTSEELAFFASGQLRRINRNGGPASLVVADPDMRSGAWTDTGDIVVSLVNRGLARVPAAGGRLEPMAGTDVGFVRNLDPNVFGGHLIFTQFGGETGLYASDLDGGNRRLLIAGVEGRTRLVGDVLVRDNAGVLIGQTLNLADMTLVGDPFPITENIGTNGFAGSRAGVFTYVRSSHAVERLTWFTRAGEPAGTVGPEGEFGEVALSAGDRWLVFVQQDPSVGTADVWSQDLTGGEAVRLTSDPGVDHLLALSPDEREVAWEAHAAGALNVMARPLDASASTRLVRQWGRGGGPTDWSPDGRFLLYESIDPTNGNNLWAVPLDGSAEPFPLIEDEFDDTDGRFSPDGRWLAYVSSASGRGEVYLQQLDGMSRVGGPRRVSRTGGREPLWRGDGRELYFLNDRTVMAVDLSDDERAIGTPRALFSIERLRLRDRSYAVTSDGQRFVAIVGSADAAAQPATVILNWQPASRR